CARDHSGYDYW
nr:immunoglobulin heavy chain junction region [Macaca mulatta]MOW75868.1 immunoglobulin heavy chain junction region [Macaca mulatta]MOW75916.1 immunoglobulin heavy chain junction region [Macaca mulatta]MOW76364.1 immunoglobulin heavy chain junction region [Macaca mulatta]MOW76512.1 immunoglobulin heavy chain junction region [Macaca mulatta]